MNASQKILFPLVSVFLVFCGALTAIKALLMQWGMDYNVLIIANGLFFAVNLLAFLLQKKALQNANPNVFVRSVMGSMLIKMFVCVAAIVMYRLLAGNAVSKISVFAAMFLYLVYLGLEVALITKMNKKNA